MHVYSFLLYMSTKQVVNSRYFSFSHIYCYVNNLNPYWTQESLAINPYFFKIQFFKKRQLTIDQPINLRTAVILVGNSLAVRIIRRDGPKRSSHMSVEKVQAVYITGVDPAKPAKERQCQIMITKREVITILVWSLTPLEVHPWNWCPGSHTLHQPGAGQSAA